MPDDRDKIGIRTFNGNYVTAVNGRGMGEDANALPIHTDAVVAQDWEKFQINFHDDGTCTIFNGYYLTAVNGEESRRPPGVRSRPMPPKLESLKRSLWRNTNTVCTLSKPLMAII